MFLIQATKIMKTGNAVTMLVLLISLGLAFSAQPSKAQVAQTGNGQNESITLSGSRLKSEDIALKCDAIFIGQIVALGDPETASAGMDTRGGSVKVLQVLRGTVGDQIGVEIDSALYPSLHEQVPTVGSTYIFFIKKAPTRNIVLKLLSATDANVTKVKALISATPASK